MFCLGSDITIGKFEKVKPHEVKIEKSVHSFLDVAYIKIPLRARVVGEYTINGQILETSKIFKEGMRVSINLGYTGQMVNEFEGFVARLNFKSPMEVVCEGYSYQLRKRTYEKNFRNSTLREILIYLTAGTDIILDKEIDDIPVTKLITFGLNGIEVLRKLKTILNNCVSFRFSKNALIAEFFPIKQERGIVEYTIGWNVINADDLKKHEAKNDDVEIHFIGRRNDGTKVKICKKKPSVETKGLLPNSYKENSYNKARCKPRLLPHTHIFICYKQNLFQLILPFLSRPVPAINNTLILFLPVSRRTFFPYKKGLVTSIPAFYVSHKTYHFYFNIAIVLYMLRQVVFEPMIYKED